MNEEILLYECPNLPGNAKITCVQCGRNRRRAQRAAKLRLFTKGRGNDLVRNPRRDALIHLGPCVDCPGVVELAARNEIPAPTVYPGPMVRVRPKPRQRPKRIGHNIWIRNQTRLLAIEPEDT